MSLPALPPRGGDLVVQGDVLVAKFRVSKSAIYYLLGPGGGGYLVYFADGMCTSFRVSFSAINSKAGYLFY